MRDDSDVDTAILWLSVEAYAKVSLRTRGTEFCVANFLDCMEIVLS